MKKILTHRKGQQATEFLQIFWNFVALDYEIHRFWKNEAIRKEPEKLNDGLLVGVLHFYLICSVDNFLWSRAFKFQSCQKV